LASAESLYETESRHSLGLGTATFRPSNAGPRGTNACGKRGNSFGKSANISANRVPSPRFCAWRQGYLLFGERLNPGPTNTPFEAGPRVPVSLKKEGLSPSGRDGAWSRQRRGKPQSTAFWLALFQRRSANRRRRWRPECVLPTEKVLGVTTSAKLSATTNRQGRCLWLYSASRNGPAIALFFFPESEVLGEPICVMAGRPPRHEWPALTEVDAEKIASFKILAKCPDM